MATEILASLRATAGGRFWGRTLGTGWVRTWMGEPAVRRYINSSVSGSPDCWPIDWFKSRLAGRTFDRAISLGCGAGALERDLVSKGICAHVVGVDISSKAIGLAIASARRDGLHAISYEVGNLNRFHLRSGTYDAAFFHQSLHHVERLDDCLDAVVQGLKPGGIAYFDEYVGPARAEWSRALLTPAQELFNQLPPHTKHRRTLGLPVDWRDPTEAVRSSHIRGAVEARFDILEQRNYGGNFLSVIYPHLRLDSIPTGERDQLLGQVIAAERAHLAAGSPSFYTILVGVPKIRNPERAQALAHQEEGGSRRAKCQTR